jgi:hypothetical protein
MGRSLATLAACSTFMAVFIGYLAIVPNARMHRDLVRDLANPALVRLKRILKSQR